MKTFASLALLAAFLFGCSTDAPKSTRARREYPIARDDYPFILKISNYFGAAGFGFEYILDEGWTGLSFIFFYFC
jgi:hypothetical protein